MQTFEVLPNAKCQLISCMLARCFCCLLFTGQALRQHHIDSHTSVGGVGVIGPLLMARVTTVRPVGGLGVIVSLLMFGVGRHRLQLFGIGPFTCSGVGLVTPLLTAGECCNLLSLFGITYQYVVVGVSGG